MLPLTILLIGAPPLLFQIVPHFSKVIVWRKHFRIVLTLIARPAELTIFFN